jgi:DNA-binding transcriptional MerR regulator
MQLSLEDLVSKVNEWCDANAVTPASGQVAGSLSVRTLRYYRAVGLLDAPSSGAGAGYGEHHFLQVAAVRVLQSQGLPQNRIQSLLFGRSDKELRKILQHADAGTPAASRAPRVTAFPNSESWQMTPITDDFLLVARQRSRVTDEALARIREILAETSSTTHRSH